MRLQQTQNGYYNTPENQFWWVLPIKVYSHGNPMFLFMQIKQNLKLPLKFHNYRFIVSHDKPPSIGASSSQGAPGQEEKNESEACHCHLSFYMD